MHANFVGEPVLAHALGFPISSDYLADAMRQFISFHATRVWLWYFLLYALISRLLKSIIRASMIRITDLETELEMDVSLPDVLEDALRIQLSRSQENGRRTTFAADVAAWLAVAVFQSVDRDLWPPSERQRRYATDIGEALGVCVPDEAFQYRGSMNAFLTHFAPLHNEQSKGRGTRS